MRDGDADVFVEMEARDLRPVDAGLLDERLEELELARARRDDYAGLALLGYRLADLVRRHVGRLLGHVIFVLAYIDLHRICISLSL